jgi:hypothetical protein
MSTIGSSTDIAASLIAQRQQMTQEQMGIAMIRKEMEAQQALIALLTESAGPPPSPGTGQAVDRRA